MKEKTKIDSLNLAEYNIAKIKQIFPEIVSDGLINFEKLKLILGDELENTNESYKFEWVGKRDCYKLAQTPSLATLNYCEGESLNPDSSENLIIEGDNLEVLKLLQSGYKNKIKLIYIDPPYNIGSDLVYPDNFSTNLDNYFEITGQKVAGEFVQSAKNKDGRRHSKWLNMILPRILLSRTLLKDDGVIFISIDDNELDNLKKICDEVFGEENNLGVITRCTGTTTGQDGSQIGSSLDYILVYQKTSLFDLRGLELSDKDKARFKDSDKKGKYSTLQLRKTGSGDRREDRKNMFYAIKDPDGNDVFPIGPTGYESRWRVGKKTYLDIEKEGLVVWKLNKQGVKTPYVKYYLENRTKQVSNLWDDIDGNKKGTRELTEVFGDKIFNNPKPVELVKKILKITTDTDKSDIVLDFFAGSGTTGQSVLSLNKEDKGNRKFILIQLPEPLSDKVKDQKLALEFLKKLKKPTNIAEITKERIRRVILGYGESPSPINDGFKIFKLAKSNYKVVDEIEKNENSDREELIATLRKRIQSSLIFDDSLIDNYKEIDVVYETLLKEGFSLNSTIEKIKIEKTNLYRIYNKHNNGRLIYITFEKPDKKLTDDKEFKDINEETLLVCFDLYLSDSDKANLLKTFKVKTM
tara:strand:+ start:219 stop:2129 length:1911 start_codon:yes stop_codon:yes gene_type:complete